MLLTPLLPSARRQQKFVRPFALRPLAVLYRRSAINPVFSLALFGSLMLHVVSSPSARAQAAACSPRTPGHRKGATARLGGPASGEYQFRWRKRKFAEAAAQPTGSAAGFSSGPAEDSRKPAQPVRHRPLPNHRSGRAYARATVSPSYFPAFHASLSAGSMWKG